MSLISENVRIYLTSHLRPELFLIVGVAGVVVYLIVSNFARQPNKTKLPDLPWVGKNSTLWFGSLRTRWWTMLNYESALELAYREV